MKMKFNIDHTFGWPLEKIAPMLAQEELIDFEELPNVSKRRVIEKRREGNKLYKVCEWNVHGQIPKAAQRMIRPDMLTFTEHTVWDDDTCTFDSRIEPHFLRSIVKVSTRSAWESAGPDKTHRRIETILDIRIPIIAQIMEHTIVEHIKKNTEKNAEVVRRVLTRRLGPQAA